MKLIHLSDLHLGKKVNGFSMLEDQKYILQEISEIINSEKIEAVLISGDIYDKSVPQGEAVELFDSFLSGIFESSRKVFIISGNHDSAERIAFGSKIMAAGNFYVSPVYRGNIEKISLNDDYGVINFYLMPFLKPAYVRQYFPETDILSANDAVKTVIGNIQPDYDERNVILAHQFVAGADISESEEAYVGGTDIVDGGIFDGFDYVALGHIHRAQSVGRNTVRYCGSPVKYSFSEASHVKSVTIADIKEKGNVEVYTIPLKPLRDMVEIKGTYIQITAKDFYERLHTDDYMHITLTDEEDVPDAMGKLRLFYPNIMRLDYENTRTGHNNEIGYTGETEHKSGLMLLEELFELQNNKAMTEEQRKLAEDIFLSIEEDKE
ncbi:MAG: exonuclease SbcCD subunit D [Butyrivibrio sp.]